MHLLFVAHYIHITFQPATTGSNQVRVASTNDGLSIKVYDPVAMITRASLMRRNPDIEAIDTRCAVAAIKRLPSPKVTRWARATMNQHKLFTHHKVFLSKPGREMTCISMLIRVHKKNNFITCLTPGNKLLHQITNKQFPRGASAASFSEVTNMLPPDCIPRLVPISKGRGRGPNWAISRHYSCAALRCTHQKP